MIPDSATGDLCECLRRIAALLERGQPVEAAAVADEMNALLPHLPAQMPQEKADEARTLLAHCAILEEGLRQHVLTSLQRLAATRKSMGYRRQGSGP
jgi:hypothetical protein